MSTNENTPAQLAKKRAAVRAALARAGVQHQQAAQILGVSPPTFCNVLAGRARMPALWFERVMAICGVNGGAK